MSKTSGLTAEDEEDEDLPTAEELKEGNADADLSIGEEARVFIVPEFTCPTHLSNIWKCPMIEQKVFTRKNISRLTVNVKSWQCGWRKSKYLQWNASKALGHVNKLTGYNIRPCPAAIHPDWSSLYTKLMTSKGIAKDQKKTLTDRLAARIAEDQVSRDIVPIVCLVVCHVY